MCLHYYHVDVYNERAEQIDTIDLTRTIVMMLML